MPHCKRLLLGVRVDPLFQVIEEKTPAGMGDPYLHPYIGAGEAVGGVVEPEEPSEKVQLQRIVSRCSCEIYFCYFSEELKTDALEETGVPKVRVFCSNILVNK